MPNSSVTVLPTHRAPARTPSLEAVLFGQWHKEKKKRYIYWLHMSTGRKEELDADGIGGGGRVRGGPEGIAQTGHVSLQQRVSLALPSSGQRKATCLDVNEILHDEDTVIERLRGLHAGRLHVEQIHKRARLVHVHEPLPRQKSSSLE